MQTEPLAASEAQLAAFGLAGAAASASIAETFQEPLLCGPLVALSRRPGPHAFLAHSPAFPPLLLV